MKINISSVGKYVISHLVGTDTASVIFAFCDSGLADAFNSLKDVIAALKTGNLDRIEISIASFLDHLPKPVREAVVAYVIKRFNAVNGITEAK